MSALQPVTRDYFITMANYTRWSQKLTIASGCNELYLCVYLLPRSGECRSVAEEQERRLVMTGSVCLDKFIVDTERLSASRIQKKQQQKKHDKCISVLY